jgi:hypothetical protein
LKWMAWRELIGSLGAVVCAVYPRKSVDSVRPPRTEYSVRTA